MSGKSEMTHKMESFLANEEYVNPLEPVITMGAAAKMLDISVSMLRKYEAEGLMIYYRTETGRRMLCQEDIMRIKLLRNLNKVRGINFEGIRRLMALLPCWELRPCSEEQKANCAFLRDSSKPCWTLKDTQCAKMGADCRTCEVYRIGAYCTEDIKALVHSEVTSKKDIDTMEKP